MKKKWLSIIALLTCFIIGVGSFAGCGKSGVEDSSSMISQDSELENSESQSMGEDETDEQPLSKDEIYAMVMQAVENTEKYRGAVTLDFGQREMETNGGKITMREIAERQSINPTEKQVYTRGSLTQVYNGETSVSASISKIFKEGDSYYTVRGEAEFDGTHAGGDLVAAENYLRVTENYVDRAMGNVGLSGFSFEIFGFPTDISSVDDWNAAFAEVFASSKAEIDAYATDEGSEWYQYAVDGGCLLTCEEKGDELIVKMRLDTEMTKVSGATGESKEIELVAVSGYLTKLVMKNWRGSASSGDITQYDYEWELTYSYAIGYEFDQAGYDGITTTLPENVENYVEDSGFSTYLDIYINGILASGGHSVWGDDERDAYTDFMRSMEQWYDGMDISWYTDEACTKPFTVADLGKVDAIYGKATLHEGYAFLITKDRTVYASDVPEAYKMVIEIFNGELKSSEGIEARSTDDSLDVYKREGMVVTVNGEIVTFEEPDGVWMNIPITAGETYVVEYVRSYTKADLNIFNSL